MAATPNTGQAEAALRLILAGDSKAGFEQYEASLIAEQAHVPVGLHCSFLEQAGRAEDAARLKAMGVEQGADVALRAQNTALATDAAAAASEYEALFDTGAINARMIHSYLKALASLGRTRELAELMAPGDLFRQVMLGGPDPERKDDSLPAAVDRLLLALEDEAEEQEAVQSVRSMRVLHKIELLDHPVAKAIVEQLGAHIAQYMERWRSSRHRFARFVPERYRIGVWGLISRGQGYNIAHIHHLGWATGVFYPRGVPGPGGELLVSLSEEAGEGSASSQVRITPEAGLLVLMPSFYKHSTEPLEGAGIRTSVAFDVMAL